MSLEKLIESLNDNRRPVPTMYIASFLSFLIVSLFSSFPFSIFLYAVLSAALLNSLATCSVLLTETKGLHS